MKGLSTSVQTVCDVIARYVEYINSIGVCVASRQPRSCSFIGTMSLGFGPPN